jgi:hypothetical protein
MLCLQAEIASEWPCCCGLCCGLHAHKAHGGCCMLYKMACGLGRAFGFSPLLSLLCSPDVDLAVAQPKELAEAMRVPATYDARLHKGVNPLGVRAWPLGPDAIITFGSAQLSTSAIPEENNGHLLFAKARFTPKLLIHQPAAAFSFSPARGRPLAGAPLNEQMNRDMSA